jgi:hypothetical protein
MTTQARDGLLPTAVGRFTANLQPWQRFAVFPPTAVGGKGFVCLVMW